MTKVVVLGHDTPITAGIVRSLGELPEIETRLTDLAHLRGIEADILINCDDSAEFFPARLRSLEDLHEGVSSVYESLFAAKVPTHVYFSSVDVYGDVSRPETTREDQADEQPPTLFGFHKRQAEVLIERHARRAFLLRLGALVGPNLRHNPLYNLLDGEPIEISRHSRLSVLHVSFLNEVLASIVTGKLPPGAYNVTGRGSIGLEEVARRVGREARERRESAPLYRYEINTDRLESHLRVPEARAMADRFLKGGHA